MGREAQESGPRAWPTNSRGLWLPAPTSQYLLKGPLEAALILGSLVPAASTERRHGPRMGATRHWEGLRCGQAGPASDMSNKGGWASAHLQPKHTMTPSVLSPIVFLSVSLTSQTLSCHLGQMKCCSSCLEYSSLVSQLRHSLFWKAYALDSSRHLLWSPTAPSFPITALTGGASVAAQTPKHSSFRVVPNTALHKIETKRELTIQPESLLL